MPLTLKKSIESIKQITKRKSNEPITIPSQTNLQITSTGNTYHIMDMNGQLVHTIENIISNSDQPQLAWYLNFKSLHQQYIITRIHKSNRIEFKGMDTYTMNWVFKDESGRAFYEVMMEDYIVGVWKPKAYGGYKYVIDNGHILGELDESDQVDGLVTLHAEGYPFTDLLCMTAFMIVYRNIV